MKTFLRRQRAAARAPHRPGVVGRSIAGANRVLRALVGAPAAKSHDVTATVAPALASGGAALPARVQHFFEPRFGRDLSAVRVHTGPEAAASARALNANAYTYKHDVVFDAGAYQPDTPHGRRLIAHELTHVLQQDARASPRVQRDDKDKPKAPTFPKSGVQITGKDADALVKILTDCTGLGLKLDAAQMLTVTSKAEKKGAGISPTARAQIIAMTEKPSHGIVIDTGSPGPFVGQFSHDFPGYHQVDLGDIKTLAGAGGEPGGATACDMVLHEVSEAFIGRGISLEGKVKGHDIYDKSHAQALAIEAKVRADLGRGARAEKSSMEFLGQEGSDSTLWLDSSPYVKSKTTVSQLSILRGKLGPEKDGTRNVESLEIVASRVVKGEVKFSSRDEAIVIFNKYASDFGFKPIPVPKKAEDQKPKK